MRKLVAFESVSLDGYFTDAKGDIGWAHGPPDAEFDGFIADNASGGGLLLLGRKTYELMASYWPTPLAREQAPAVAKGMNELPKLVFSRTMDRPEWSNTTVVKGDPAGAVQRMKRDTGPDMVVLGSGSIVSLLAREGLIDEYQLVINPVVLGGGRTLFEGLPARQALWLARSRLFRNGKVFLCYQASPP